MQSHVGGKQQLNVCFWPVLYFHFIAFFRVFSVEATEKKRLNMKNYKPTKYQPKSHILFHKNVSPRDLYIMTLMLHNVHTKYTIVTYCTV